MARIDAAYNYLLSTYGKATGSRYDSHKKSELRSLYNNIIKTNKESPLYKITQTGMSKNLPLISRPMHTGCKAPFLRSMMTGDDIASMLKKKVAVSSDEDTISVHFVGNDADQEQNGFDMEVISLAGPQTNEGHYLRRNDYKL